MRLLTASRATLGRRDYLSKPVVEHERQASVVGAGRHACPVIKVLMRVVLQD
jgi:hypothetical protein